MTSVFTCRLAGFACAASLLVSATALAQTPPPAKTLNTLMFFYGTTPSGNIVADSNAVSGNGTLFGATYATSPGAAGGLFYQIGQNACFVKTVYQYGLTYDNNLNRIYLGSNPSGQLLRTSDGNFYGVTQNKGLFGEGGSIYHITSNGAYTRLDEFDAPTVDYTRNSIGYAVNTTGLQPTAPLIEGFEGGVQYLYGTTPRGGVNGTGVVFKFRVDTRELTVLHHFGEAYVDAVTAGDPPLPTYTPEGHPIVNFRTNPDGRLQNLDGVNPDRRLLLGSDGRLYGVTPNGGPDGTGVVFSVSRNAADPGTHRNPDFRMGQFDPSPATVEAPPADTTPAPDLTDPDGEYFGYGKRKLNATGAYPLTSLVQIGNYVYGTTSSLGAYPGDARGTLPTKQPYSATGGHGTLFRIEMAAASYAIDVMFHFTGGENNRLSAGTPVLPDRPGSSASGDLIVINGDTIVGTTQGGGILTDSTDPDVADTSAAGTVFTYDVNDDTTTSDDIYDTPVKFGADGYTFGYAPSYGVIAVDDGNGGHDFYGITNAGGVWGQGTVFKYGGPVPCPARGTPEPYDDGGGSIGKWLIAALLLMATVQLIALRHRRLRAKRAQAR